MNYGELEEARQIFPKKFTAAISEMFGLEISGLEKLQEHFELWPRGGQAPDEDAAVEMSMTEIAEEVKLPIKVVGRLQDIGVIDKPITYKNLYFLKIYQKTWGNMFLIKTQLARYSQSQREEILTRPELSTKWEKWIYSRYFNNELDYAKNGRMLSPEKRIRIDDVLDFLEERYSIPNCLNTRNRVKKIREMAYNDKKRGKSEGFWKGRF